MADEKLGTEEKTEEQLRQGEGFLVKLVGKEVMVGTQIGPTYGVVKEINSSEGYLFLSPVLIQDPMDETFSKSDYGKYISLGLFEKGRMYEVMPFPKGQLDRMIEARKRKAKLGF